MYRGRKARFQLLKRSLAALAVLASPSALYAQSCALCYQTAANSGTQFIQALKHGILILLFPPLCIGIGIGILAYRKRYQYAEEWESADNRDAVLSVPAMNTFSGTPESLVALSTDFVAPNAGQ
jgi:hypothetical protein